MITIISLFVFALLLSCSAQTLPGVVSDVSELSIFFKLLNSIPELYEQAKKGDVTILAPTDSAFTNAGITRPKSISASELEALLSYHVVQGYHPSAAFSGPPKFLPTLLEDKSYTNKTGGQVVQVGSIDGTSEVTSGLWATSRIVTGDIFFINGLIHSIDAVLSIPETNAQTITGAHLSDYVALGRKTDIVRLTDDPRVFGSQFWPNVTIFVTNSSEYSTDFTGWDGIDLEDQFHIWKYHMVNGSALYSTLLQNGSSFTTADGVNVTSWRIGDDVYINDAKIKQPDLLISNGVMQVLDKPLDPNNTDSRPLGLVKPSNAAQKDQGPDSGLSTSSQAGVGVGVALAGLAVVGAVAYFVGRRRSRQTKAQELDGSNNDPNVIYGSDRGMNNLSSWSKEMGTTANVWEMENASAKYEMPTPAPVSELEGDGRRQYEMK